MNPRWGVYGNGIKRISRNEATLCQRDLFIIWYRFKNEGVEFVSRETSKTEPKQVLTFITRAPRGLYLYRANLRMHGTNVEKAYASRGSEIDWW